MIINVKNKDTLVIDNFRFKCCIGKNGLNHKKREGDYTTPKGIFNLDKLYFRKDRLGDIKCNLTKKIITKSMAWCDDSKNKRYNKEIQNSKKNNRECLFRKDHKYDYIITISHNQKGVPNRGSAIFLHLTNNYKPTAGCIALKKKDFQILIKLIDKKTKIKIG